MTIDLKYARELLPKAVETQGREFVYNPGGDGNCQYQPQTALPADDPRSKTGCVVGVALDLAGETRHRLNRGSVIGGLFYDIPGLMTREAAEYFQEAQNVQDAGGTWGAALDWAEEWLQLATSADDEDNEQ